MSRRVRSRVVWRRLLYPVWFGYCPDEESFAFEMRRANVAHTYPENDGCCVVYRDEREDWCALVTLSPSYLERSRARIDAVASLLVHESVHVAMTMVEKAEDHHPSEELMAYTVQGVFSQLLADYRASRRRAKI